MSPTGLLWIVGALQFASHWQSPPGASLTAAPPLLETLVTDAGGPEALAVGGASEAALRAAIERVPASGHVELPGDDAAACDATRGEDAGADGTCRDWRALRTALRLAEGLTLAPLGASVRPTSLEDRWPSTTAGDSRPGIVARIVIRDASLLVPSAAGTTQPGAADSALLNQAAPEPVVLACFNRPSKFDPMQWDVWMGVLRRAPAALLWLYGGGPVKGPTRWPAGSGNASSPHIAVLQAEAAARGVYPSRIVFAARAKRAAHLFRHYAADFQVRIMGSRAGRLVKYMRAPFPCACSSTRVCTALTRPPPTACGLVCPCSRAPARRSPLAWATRCCGHCLARRSGTDTRPSLQPRTSSAAQQPRR